MAGPRMNAPRVLVLGTVLDQPMGGVRRHNRELLPRAARLLAARGGGLAVLAGRGGVAFDLPGVEVLAGDAPSRPLALRAALEPRAMRRALDAAAARGKPYDLVHTAHLPVPGACPVPLTLAVHDLRSFAPRLAGLPRRLAARGALARARDGCRMFLAVSQAVADELHARLGLDASALAVVGNGGDHFQPLPRSAGSAAPLRAIGHVEPRKNLELVLRALAADPSLPDLEVHGAAKDGEDERLRALAEELGVGGRVRFRGPFEEQDLPRLHATAAAVCVPSLVEGFGIVALEAQLALAPLAVSAIPALRETAPSAPSFDPRDAQACAAALRRALAAGRDELEAAAHMARGRTWDACAQRLVDAWCAAAARA